MCGCQGPCLPCVACISPGLPSWMNISGWAAYDVWQQHSPSTQMACSQLVSASSCSATVHNKMSWCLVTNETGMIWIEQINIIPRDGCVDQGSALQQTPPRLQQVTARSEASCSPASSAHKGSYPGTPAGG